MHENKRRRLRKATRMTVETKITIITKLKRWMSNGEMRVRRVAKKTRLPTAQSKAVLGTVQSIYLHLPTVKRHRDNLHIYIWIHDYFWSWIHAIMPCENEDAPRKAKMPTDETMRWIVDKLAERKNGFRSVIYKVFCNLQHMRSYNKSRMTCNLRSNRTFCDKQNKEKSHQKRDWTWISG